MNKKIIKTNMVLLALLAQSNSFAGTVQQKEDNLMAMWSAPKVIYLALSAGDSESMNTRITADSSFWDITSETYHNNLHASEILGAAVGYVFNPLSRVEIGVDRRNSFRYVKHHSAENATFFGARTRYFDLINTTVMSTLFFNGSGISEHAYAKAKTFMIDPFFGVGIGLAFNTIDNLHSISNTQQGVISPTHKVFSFMTAPRTTRVFAYQLIAGFDIKTTEKLAFGFNYRYLDAGRFESNNYVGDGALRGMTVPPWKGDLKINEVYATIKYAIA